MSQRSLCASARDFTAIERNTLGDFIGQFEEVYCRSSNAIRTSIQELPATRRRQNERQLSPRRVFSPGRRLASHEPPTTCEAAKKHASTKREIPRAWHAIVEANRKQGRQYEQRQGDKEIGRQRQTESRHTGDNRRLVQSNRRYFDFFCDFAAGALRRRRAACGRMIGRAVARGSSSSRANGTRCNWSSSTSSAMPASASSRPIT